MSKEKSIENHENADDIFMGIVEKMSKRRLKRFEEKKLINGLFFGLVFGLIYGLIIALVGGLSEESECEKE
jgi:hypothetical protein